MNQGNATERGSGWSRLLGRDDSKDGSLKREKLLLGALAEREGLVAGRYRDDNL